MRRLAIGFLALLAAGLLGGCVSGYDWSDPLHPRVERPTDYQP